MYYKLEIKSILVRTAFQPSAGWNVCVNIDGFEKGYDDPGKRERVAPAEDYLRSQQIRIGRHLVFGAKDIVAEHPILGTVVAKVIGIATEQPEQQLYSALGQLIRTMNSLDGAVAYAIAAPDDQEWVSQLLRIPQAVRKALQLKLWAVTDRSLRDLPESMPDAD